MLSNIDLRLMLDKDFGDSIPGHGGFTDRFDCQILMGGFAYLYHSSFIKVSERHDRSSGINRFVASRSVNAVCLSDDYVSRATRAARALTATAGVFKCIIDNRPLFPRH